MMWEEVAKWMSREVNPEHVEETITPKRKCEKPIGSFSLKQHRHLQEGTSLTMQIQSGGSSEMVGAMAVEDCGKRIVEQEQSS